MQKSRRLSIYMSDYSANSISMVDGDNHWKENTKAEPWNVTAFLLSLVGDLMTAQFARMRNITGRD